MTQVSIEGNDKDRVVVIGEDVDTVCLGRMLRKKFRGVTVLTVEEVKPPKPPENKDKDKDKDKDKGKEKGKDDKGKDKGKDGKDKDKDKDKLKTCTVCIVPCNPCPGLHCDPCSRCHSQKCHGECKACAKCESLKCHGDCKACARCGSFKCSGQCAPSICLQPPLPACYGHCPPWMSCPSCCLKRPYDPYCYRVVYDSSADSCSIQ